jgi:hypothetical protein
MRRKIMLLTPLMFATVALIFAGLSNGGAAAGTATPNVVGTWEGTWSHRVGSGQITLRLAQEGTKVTGRQSVIGVMPVFGDQTQRLTLGEEIRDGHIEDSTLIFHVEARDAPASQVNFTLSVSGDSMTGTVCGHTCGVIKLQKSKL